MSEARAAVAAVTSEAERKVERADEDKAAAEQRAEEVRRRALRAVVVMAIAAVLISLAAAVLSLTATRAEARRTEDIAATLAEPVAQRVLSDGRAESARAARDVLRGANTRLISSRLPIVPEPPPETLSQVVAIQASRALLLADLGSVDVIAEGLREQYGDRGAFPAAFLDRIEVPASATAAGDVSAPTLPADDEPTVVEVPPGLAPPSSPARPRTGPTPAPSRAAPRLAPRPGPPPARPAPPAQGPAPAPRPAPLLPGVRLPPLIG